VESPWWGELELILHCLPPLIHHLLRKCQLNPNKSYRIVSLIDHISLTNQEHHLLRKCQLNSNKSYRIISLIDHISLTNQEGLAGCQFGCRPITKYNNSNSGSDLQFFKNFWWRSCMQSQENRMTEFQIPLASSSGHNNKMYSKHQVERRGH